MVTNIHPIVEVMVVLTDPITLNTEDIGIEVTVRNMVSRKLQAAARSQREKPPLIKPCLLFDVNERDVQGSSELNT